MHMGVLRDVERGQVKSEGTDPSDEAPHQEISRVPPAIGKQAVRGQLNVGQQFIGALIRIRPPIVGGLQAFTQLTEKNPIRLSVVPRGCELLTAGQQAAVGLHPASERRADFDAVRTLAQGLGELAALIEIGRYDELLMAMQRLADGLTVHVGIAVHVAADPGTEMQDARHLERVDRYAVRLRQSRLDFLVKQRHHAI